MKLSTIEATLKRRSKIWMKQIETSGRAIEVAIFRPTEDVHQAVYGIDAGGPPTIGETPTETLKAMITGDDFFPTSGFSSGSFKEGWMYTSSDFPVPGDVAQIVSSDGKIRRFRIEVKEALGTTTDVFYRFRLAAMGT